MIKLIAICVGGSTTLTYRDTNGELKTLTSTMNKRSISTTDLKNPVEIRKSGIMGDEITYSNQTHCSDQVLYMMPAKHYSFWNQQRSQMGLNNPITWGFLGENLVIDGVDETLVHIGDRFIIGQIQLEITTPHIPQADLSIKMGYAQAKEQMIQTGYCGWHLKVLQNGTIHADDQVHHIGYSENPSVLSTFRKTFENGQLTLI